MVPQRISREFARVVTERESFGTRHPKYYRIILAYDASAECFGRSFIVLNPVLSKVLKRRDITQPVNRPAIYTGGVMSIALMMLGFPSKLERGRSPGKN